MATGVVREIDVRLFPMEIAKKLLNLGYSLSMSKGPTAYFEAEKSLIAYLDVLSVYAQTIWQGSRDFRMQQKAVERYVSMHASNPNLIESQARKLLDFISYFPEVKDATASNESQSQAARSLSNDDH